MRLQRSMGTTTMGSVTSAGTMGRSRSISRPRARSGASPRASTRSSRAISSAVIHAPSANLATSTTSVVMPVATAPRPLTIMRTGASPLRFQCITMPACESVKAMKAPMA